jgi:hypothetical protein
VHPGPSFDLVDPEDPVHTDKDYMNDDRYAGAMSLPTM